MKLADFENLPIDQQLNTLYFMGDILANRYEDDAIFLLYAFQDYYVELKYDTYTSTLHRVKAFRDTDTLEPYLPYLSISDT